MLCRKGLGRTGDHIHPKSLSLNSWGCMGPAPPALLWGCPLAGLGARKRTGRAGEGLALWSGLGREGLWGSGNPSILSLGACSPPRTAAARR